MVEFTFIRITGQVVKHVGRVLTNFMVRSEQAQIRVDFGGKRVVIPCPEVHVTSDPITFLANNQADF